MPDHFISLTDLLSLRLRHLAEWPEILRVGRESPAHAGGLLAMAMPGGGPVMVNIGVLMARWWNSSRRTAWVVAPETAATVRNVGLAFVPEEPPDSWGPGRAIMVEGRKQCELVDGVFSLGAYVLPHHETGALHYWVVALDLSGGCRTFGIRCDQGPLNARLARDGALLDVPFREGDGWDFGLQRVHTPQEQAWAMRVLQWLFAFSYFVGQPPAEPDAGGWRTEEAGAGPPVLRDRVDGKKKAAHRGGRPLALWTYRTLRFDAAAEDDEETGEGADPEARRFDATNLERGPAIVRPHWRRVGQGEAVRVRLIGSYASHRWRRRDRLGEKVGV